MPWPRWSWHFVFLFGYKKGFRLLFVERVEIEELFLVTNVYFVRHAHSIYTPEELERPLSKRGFEDAQRGQSF